MSLTSLDIIALIAIVIVGTPHGAMDINLVLNASDERGKKIAAHVFYLLIALLSFLAWASFTTASLALFLMISTIHFGRSNPVGMALETIKVRWQGYAAVFFMGGIATVFIPALYWSEVSALFEILGADAQVIKGLGVVGVVAWAGSVVISLALVRSKRAFTVCLVLCLIALNKSVFSPLSLFGVYFCILHSSIHFLRAMRFLKAPIASPPTMFLVNTVLSWCLILAAYGFFLTEGDRLAASLSALFAVLFALTVPHMFLIDLLLPTFKPYWRLNLSAREL